MINLRNCISKIFLINEYFLGFVAFDTKDRYLVFIFLCLAHSSSSGKVFCNIYLKIHEKKWIICGCVSSDVKENEGEGYVDAAQVIADCDFQT